MIGVNMARKRNTIGCLFYVALVLLVLVVFLFNRARVQQVIEKTGFAKLFQRKQAAPVEVVVTPPEAEPAATDRNGSSPSGSSGSTPAPGSRPRGGGETGGGETGGASAPAPAQKAPADVVVELVKPATEARQQAPKDQGAAPAPVPTRTRQARLFFIAVQPDGEIQLKSVIRPVKYTDAPLTSTIEALLAGPTPAEVNQGLLSLVAPEARLRRAQVKDGTAYLDFSESFRFNSLGKEGLAAQLQQVVYSATEFSTVKRVQILLEGQTADFLGPEGLFIGKPLSRDSFQR
jgi:spore germination protein GerM